MTLPWLRAAFGLSIACITAAGTQHITPAPAGPFHVEGSRILDSKGHPFLLRGTQLPEFRLDTAARHSRNAPDFGAYSATSLSAIRLRFNMNAVRLPVNVLDAARPGFWTELAKVVRLANRLEMLVVLAAREPGTAVPSPRTASFWTRGATYFKGYPNVMFDAFADPMPAAVWRSEMQGLVQTIRATGAAQPIVAMTSNAAVALLADPNVIYEVGLRFVTLRTDEQRDVQFGFLASRAPVHANGWDLELDDAAACSAIPSDPSEASALVQSALDYFDARQISWTVSVFEPGKLVRDLSLHDATSLENGWTCGKPGYPYAGLGRLVQGHLRSSKERGLFVVSGSGGPDVARGAIALAYGPVMAERDASAVVPHPPTTLARIAVHVTDSRGETRPAGMLSVTAGWGQTNFVIPKESAPGPARMTIVREDGSSSSSLITIADTAPGFLTGHSCRGPAIGEATQLFAGGRTSSYNLSSCKAGDCRTIAIPVTDGATTRVSLRTSGLRYAGSPTKIEVTIAGVRVPVVSIAPEEHADQGIDRLTIEIPPKLRGIGEVDMVARVNGRVSNSVRIRIGGGRPVS